MPKRTSTITNEEINTVDQRFKERYNKIGPPLAEEGLAGALKQAAVGKKRCFSFFMPHGAIGVMCYNPAFKQFFDDNYVICNLVVREDSRYLLKHNLASEELLEKYQGNKNGIPFWMIFNSDGRHLADFNGFPAPQYAGDYKSFEEI